MMTFIYIYISNLFFESRHEGLAEESLASLSRAGGTTLVQFCFWNQGTKTLGYLNAVWPEFVGYVFGRILAQRCHTIPLDRRGSACSAGCTKNQLVAQPDCFQAPNFISSQSSRLRSLATSRVWACRK